jgi:hypothetical protein
MVKLVMMEILPMVMVVLVLVKLKQHVEIENKHEKNNVMMEIPLMAMVVTMFVH